MLSATSPTSSSSTRAKHAHSPLRQHRPSLSSSMQWIAAKTAKSKQSRSSEQPNLRNVIGHRNGVLGAGAQIVRTPDEALRESGMLPHAPSTQELVVAQQPRESGMSPQALGTPELVVARQESGVLPQTVSTQELVIARQPRESGMLPQTVSTQELVVARQPRESGMLPQTVSTQELVVARQPRESGIPQALSTQELVAPQEPQHNYLPSPPLPPLPSDSESDSDSDQEIEDQVPPIRVRRSHPMPDFKFPDFLTPKELEFSAPLTPPPFDPILLSDLPHQFVDRSKVVVTIETCTVTYRTTIATLTCRPSFLSSYIDSLFPRQRTDSTASSVYSTSSDDISTFKRHLASQGLLAAPANTATSLHIFLDRPSTPYAHILTYLRCPNTLPRAVRLQPMTPARLELLHGLRDEAAFLGLEHLQQLCIEELDRAQSRPCHTAGQASVFSFETTTLRNSGSSHERLKDTDEHHAPSPRLPRHLTQSPPAGWF